MASVGTFALWFPTVLLFGPVINTAPTLLTLMVESIGVALGVVAIFKARGRTLSGWLGLILNCLPALFLVLLWLWLILGRPRHH